MEGIPRMKMEFQNNSCISNLGKRQSHQSWGTENFKIAGTWSSPEKIINKLGDPRMCVNVGRILEQFLVLINQIES